MNIGDVVILTPIHQVDWSGRQPECFIVTINGVYTAPFQVPNTETEILGLVGVDNQQRTFKFYFKSGNWYLSSLNPKSLGFLIINDQELTHSKKDFSACGFK